MKRHGVFCALLCVMSCMAAEECQMLLPEAKQTLAYYQGVKELRSKSNS